MGWDKAEGCFFLGQAHRKSNNSCSNPFTLRRPANNNFRVEKLTSGFQWVMPSGCIPYPWSPRPYSNLDKKDGHPGVHSKGKFWGEGPIKQVRIMWTSGWVEPGNKWMMAAIGHIPRMVTIIHFLSACVGTWTKITLKNDHPGKMPPGHPSYPCKCLSRRMYPDKWQPDTCRYTKSNGLEVEYLSPRCNCPSWHRNLVKC